MEKNVTISNLCEYCFKKRSQFHEGYWSIASQFRLLVPWTADNDFFLDFQT